MQLTITSEMCAKMCILLFIISIIFTHNVSPRDLKTYRKERTAACPHGLLIGHATVPAGLRALTSLRSNPGLEGVFQLEWASEHATRLNSWTGIEGSPVSTINCDTWHGRSRIRAFRSNIYRPPIS